MSSGDTKYHEPTPSEISRGNVVDQFEPNGTHSPMSLPPTTMATSLQSHSMSEVTDERPAGPSLGKKAMGNGTHVIKVQPLKRSEMQVRRGGSPPRF